MNKIFSEYLDKIENALENALPEVPDQNWIKSSFSNLSEYAKQEHFSPRAKLFCLQAENAGAHFF